MQLRFPNSSENKHATPSLLLPEKLRPLTKSPTEQIAWHGNGLTHSGQPRGSAGLPIAYGRQYCRLEEARQIPRGLPPPSVHVPMANGGVGRYLHCYGLGGPPGDHGINQRRLPDRRALGHVVGSTQAVISREQRRSGVLRGGRSLGCRSGVPRSIVRSRLGHSAPSMHRLCSKDGHPLSQRPGLTPPHRHPNILDPTTRPGFVR